MSTSLAIFIAIAATGCVFLLYFLYALWRDAEGSKHRGRAHITALPVLRARRGKLLHLFSAEELGTAKRVARNSRIVK